MFQLLLEAQVINPKKGIVRSKAWVSKSFVKNFLHLLYGNFKTSTATYPVDTGGTTQDNSNGYETPNLIRCLMGYGGGRIFAYLDNNSHLGDDIGILIGNGSAANTALTYTLHQQIAHGTGSGQMEYSGGLFGIVTISGSDSYFDIERIFRNSSGGSIVVKEYGIVVLWGDYSYNVHEILIVRDVFTDPGDWVTVANGEYLKVTYRLLVTV